MKVVRIDNVVKEPFVSPLFTGSDVTKQDLLPDSNDFTSSIVNFGKGVRNKFHVHDTEQLLIVTRGKGIVATEKEEILVGQGDVIFFPAGEKHWHGATQDFEFSHIFITKRGHKTTQLEH